MNQNVPSEGCRVRGGSRQWYPVPGTKLYHAPLLEQVRAGVR